MLGRLRPHLSYANVMASLAMFIVLGGGAYAATVLPRNSVGTKQLKKSAVTGAKIKGNAVTTGKVRDGSLLATDFKPGQLVAGAPGLQGPKGDKGDPGAQGVQGEQGEAGPFPGTLPGGKTVRGIFAATTVASAGSQRFEDSISFGFRFASTPTAHYVKSGDPATADCPGTSNDPEAAAGHLCVYEDQTTNIEATGSGRGCVYFNAGCGTSSRQGSVVYFEANAAGSAYVEGSWAATSP